MIGAIIIGLIAGWLTGKLMKGRGYGIFADILLGLVGAVIGSWIFNAMGIVVYGRIKASSRWRRWVRSSWSGSSI